MFISEKKRYNICKNIMICLSGLSCDTQMYATLYIFKYYIMYSEFSTFGSGCSWLIPYGLVQSLEGTPSSAQLVEQACGSEQ